jgi:hypothetical protein
MIRDGRVLAIGQELSHLTRERRTWQREEVGFFDVEVVLHGSSSDAAFDVVVAGEDRTET